MFLRNIGYLFSSAGVLFALAQLTFGLNPPEISARVALRLSTLIFLMPDVICLVIFFRNIGAGRRSDEWEEGNAKAGL